MCNFFEGEVVLIVSVEQVLVQLLSYHLVWNHELGLSLVSSVYRHHAEIEEEAHEVVGVANLFGREAIFKLASDVTLGNELLESIGLMTHPLLFFHPFAFLSFYQFILFTLQRWLSTILGKHLPASR